MNILLFAQYYPVTGHWRLSSSSVPLSEKPLPQRATYEGGLCEALGSFSEGAEACVAWGRAFAALTRKHGPEKALCNPWGSMELLGSPVEEALLQLFPELSEESYSPSLLAFLESEEWPALVEACKPQAEARQRAREELLRELFRNAPLYGFPCDSCGAAPEEPCRGSRGYKAKSCADRYVVPAAYCYGELLKRGRQPSWDTFAPCPYCGAEQGVSCFVKGKAPSERAKATHGARATASQVALVATGNPKTIADSLLSQQ